MTANSTTASATTRMLALTPAPQLIVASTRNRREVGGLIGSLARADVHPAAACFS
jgi:hypothetical protein